MKTKQTGVYPNEAGTGYCAVLDGAPIAADFNSQGAALAGLDVERRRRHDRDVAMINAHHAMLGPDPVLYSKEYFAREEAAKLDATQARLLAAFKLVEDPSDWKAPIDAMVKPEELKDVYEAVIHFTGCVPVVTFLGAALCYTTGPRFQDGDLVLRVRAAGYRMGPAGCR